MDDPADDVLVDRARAGDRGALAQLLERYQGRVHRFGLKMCGHPEDAEDVLQETLLAATRSIGTFKGDASLSTWLYTIARSFCIKKRRKSKFAPTHEASLDEAVEAVDPARGPDALAADAEVSRAIEAAIGTLDPAQREVFLLRDVEGLSAREVADVVGISVAAVKSRLHRARLEVRKQVAPVLRSDEAAPNADCPDILATYSQNLEGEISADLCAQMKAHIDGCPACASRCEALSRTLALCSALPAARVPISVQDAVRQALQLPKAP
ncbi:MAG: sigma-70 family RNA polymerase sigma factor [Deltaproteobacteria bacterium]